MILAFENVLHSFADPATLFGHFTYLLLIVSMLMRSMVWLRGLAVASGIAKIVYRTLIVVDPVSAAWETVFVAVNVAQLVIIWYYERHHKFEEHERAFVGSMPRDVARRAARRLVKLASVRHFEPGEVLVTEGQPVEQLMFLTSGVVTIERNGAVIAACGAGDYVGEMSFLSGQTASATARASKAVGVLAFEQAKLKNAIETDSELRRAMESSLNINLVGKLQRANTPRPIDATT